jgi:hypothetical protein
MEGSYNEKAVRESAKAVQEAIEALGVPASIHPTGWDPDARYAVAIDLKVPVPEAERIHSFYAENGTVKALQDAIARDLVKGALFDVHPNTLDALKRVHMAANAACEAEKDRANKNAIYKRYQKMWHQSALDACQQKAEQFLEESLRNGLTQDEVMKAMKGALKSHQKAEEVSRASSPAR